MVGFKMTKQFRSSEMFGEWLIKRTNQFLKEFEEEQDAKLSEDIRINRPDDYLPEKAYKGK